MPKDFNYERLRPFDIVCTSASSLVGRLIRLYTAHLKGKNGLVEAGRMQIANHCAIVIEMENRYWLAEMVAEGLKVNSMRVYLNNPKEKIVAIKRTRYQISTNAINEKLVDLCQQTKGYDFRMVFQYLGIGRDSGSKYYCSELCETIANWYNISLDNYQLKSFDPRMRMIAPVEIQFGKWVESVENFYI
jgi:hypothetical protein